MEVKPRSAKLEWRIEIKFEKAEVKLNESCKQKKEM